MKLKVCGSSSMLVFWWLTVLVQYGVLPVGEQICRYNQFEPTVCTIPRLNTTTIGWERTVAAAIGQNFSIIYIENVTILPGPEAMESFVRTVSSLTVELEFERYYERSFSVSQTGAVEKILISYAPVLEELQIQPNGRVRELDVYNSALAQLPQGLRGLPKLGSLRTPANKLTQFTLASFSSAQKLELVDVSANKITRLLGANHTVTIGQLFATHNRLTSLDVSFFMQIADLSYVDLYQNQIMHIESSGAPVKLPVLQHLDLSDNELTSFQPLAVEFPALLRLLLDGNKLTAVPRNPGNCASLHTLSLNANRLTRVDLSSLRWAKNLSSLSLQDNQITSLAATTPLKLDALYSIWIEENELTHVSFAGCDFPNLSIVMLSSNRLSTVPANIFQQLPAVSVYMSGNAVRCGDAKQYRTQLLQGKLVLDTADNGSQCPQQTFTEMAEHTLVCCTN